MAAQSGTLFIVATPIGNLQDMTLRAIDILKAADLIAAEDTRKSKILLHHYGINTPMVSLHDYNEKQRIGFLIERLSAGKNIALISDAGTPLISDPGYQLAYAVRARNIKIIPIPGACAAIAALSAAGLPTDRFIFEGFLPAKKGQRQKRLLELQYESRTMVFYETPHRILDVLIDMMAVFGAERHAVLARELTKIFETIHGAALGDLSDWIKNDSDQRKGEIVILVRGAEPIPGIDSETERVLKILGAELPKSQAAKLTAKIFGNRASKNRLYRLSCSGSRGQAAG